MTTDVLNELDKTLEDSTNSNQGNEILGNALEGLVSQSKEDVNALTKEIDSLKDELRIAQRDKEKAKTEAERESGKAKNILEEKKKLLERVKNYEEMHQGVDESTARDILKRAKDGHSDDFELEKARLMESAVADYKQNNYDPLLDENQDLKEQNELFKRKLHDAVIRTEIVQKLVSHGVIPALAGYAATEFESRMKINDQGDRVYLNKEGYQTSTFDWRSAALVLRREKPELFAPSTGSVANPSVNSSGVQGISNPWLKETFSRTQQARMLTSNPQEAEKMKKEAAAKNKANRSK